MPGRTPWRLAGFLAAVLRARASDEPAATAWACVALAIWLSAP